MHIPENYLGPATCLAIGTAMSVVLGVSVRKTDLLESSRASTLGMTAAFSFLVMMINLPLPGGTTGHAVGAVLAAVLLGPWGACLAVTVTLALQALLFGDGGILALGANAFTMAFVMPFGGWLVFRALRRVLGGFRGTLIGLGIASWTGLNLAALATAVLLGIQPLIAHNDAGQALYNPYPLSVSVPAIMVPHMLILGFVEAAFSVAIFAFLARVSPDLLDCTAPGAGIPGPTPVGNRRVRRNFPALALVLGLLAIASPLGMLAAGTAWGEWSPDQLPGMDAGGMTVPFIPQGMAEGWQFDALFADYSLPELPSWLSTLILALGGTGMVIIVFRMAGSLGQKRRQE